MRSEDPREAAGVPFVDTGMGVELGENGSLRGLLRVTTSSSARYEHVPRRIPLADVSGGDYNHNIQIADLNAFNASLAVIKWKKMLGFYADLESEHHTTYTIDGNTLTNDEKP